MIHSTRFTCVLDTNAVYPIEVRDLLFWFAFYDLFTPKWSRHIFDEWDTVMRRKGVPLAEREKRMQIANSAIPDALVQNYESLVEGLQLPDVKDCHVLAAAIKTNANLIITSNLKDFPEGYMASFGLSAKTPDDFITDIIDLNQEISLKAYRDMVLNRSNPDMDEYQVLAALRRNGLQGTANYLHTLL